jgi:hypothetical protein
MFDLLSDLLKFAAPIPPYIVDTPLGAIVQNCVVGFHALNTASLHILDTRDRRVVYFAALRQRRCFCVDVSNIARAKNRVMYMVGILYLNIV